MTEHLPECPRSGCPACYEQGQRDCASTHAIRGLEDINRIAARGYDDGQRDAFADARKAVAALDHEPRCELVWGCDCSEAHSLECTCNRDEALAAIDALA